MDATITHLTSSPYKILTPTLHVIGQTDMVMGEARAKVVIDACKDPRIERHSGGVSPFLLNTYHVIIWTR